MAQVIFEDSFHNNNNNWKQEDTPVAKCKINGKLDQYLLHHKEVKNTLTSRIAVDFDETRDWRIEALLYKKGGTKHSGYGIVWGGKDDRNYYSLLVTGDGGWLYGKVVDKSWQNITPGWKNHDAIEGGRKGFNKFRVDKRGSRYHFYINDGKIAEIDYTPFFGNQVGFNVNRKQKIT